MKETVRFVVVLMVVALGLQSACYKRYSSVSYDAGTSDASVIDGTVIDPDGGMDANIPDGTLPDAEVDAGPPPEICDDMQDNDGDGNYDCADSECTGDPACSGGVEVCDDLTDNDGDGKIDCYDPDCWGNAFCHTGNTTPNGTEDCSNGQDDDQDGLVDCADPDCAARLCMDMGIGCICGYRHNQEFLCNDNIDNDGDGDTDCDDPDCSLSPDCGWSTTEDCEVEGDEDNDGRPDCRDADCRNHPMCMVWDDVETQMPCDTTAPMGPCDGGALSEPDYLNQQYCRPLGTACYSDYVK